MKLISWRVTCYRLLQGITGRAHWLRTNWLGPMIEVINWGTTDESMVVEIIWWGPFKWVIIWESMIRGPLHGSLV